MPALAEVHHFLGVLAFQSGQYDQATTSLAKAIQLNPTAAVYFYNLGLARSGASASATMPPRSFQEALRLGSPISPRPTTPWAIPGGALGSYLRPRNIVNRRFIYSLVSPMLTTRLARYCSKCRTPSRLL